MWHTHNHMCLCSQVWRGFFFGGKKYHHELYKEIATRPIMAKISLQKQHLFPSFHVHEFVLWELGFILIKHSKKSRDRSTFWGWGRKMHWFSDSLFYWLIDSWNLWTIDSSIQWFADSLIHWTVESLIHEFCESLNHWFMSAVHSWILDSWIRWFIDSVIYWFMDWLIHWHHWISDSLNHRLIGSFSQLCTDSYISFHWHLSHHLCIRWCTSQLHNT